MPMTKEELLTKLKAYAELSKIDTEAAHGDADKALINFIISHLTFLLVIATPVPTPC